MPNTAPVDLDFTQALPKIELHAHLSGSITRSCLHELWLRKKSQNPDFSIEDPLVSMPLGKVDFGLDTFFHTFFSSIYHLASDLESLRYATLSVLDDFAKDGVRYLELRTTPRPTPEHGITREIYITTVLDCIDEFGRSPSSPPMPTYLILSIFRTFTAAEALEIVDLAIRYRSRGVVGVDLCGDPTKGDVSIFRDAFAKAKAHGLGVTLHFAETAASSTRTELETLLSYGPDRLGHVINVPDDIQEEITKRKLGLELCLSCNVHAKLIDGGFPDHHFGYWRHRDCPVILGTDDVGFFCSPLSNEYLLAAENFHLDRAALIDLAKRAADSIFGGEKEQARFRQLIEDFAREYVVPGDGNDNARLN